MTEASVFGVPFEFLLLATTLLGVALFHRHKLAVALVGVAFIVAYKLIVTGFDEGNGLVGLGAHFQHEWVVLANLALLLTGFAILSRHFELSRLPDLAPDILPDGWTGGLVLLGLVFVTSGFLDNIASALIGATIARHLYKSRVHLGFLAAIVATAKGHPWCPRQSWTTMRRVQMRSNAVYEGGPFQRRGPRRVVRACPPLRHQTAPRPAFRQRIVDCVHSEEED